MSGVGRPVAKIAYVVELVLLATPVLLVLGILAALGAICCAGLTLIGISMLFNNASADPSDERLLFILLAPVCTALCLSGLAAIRLFVRLSRIYLLGSPEELAGKPRERV